MSTQHYFHVVGAYTGDMCNWGTETAHYRNDRNRRKRYIKPSRRQVAAFVVDRHHPDGLEVHVVTSNAVILIYNKETGRQITMLAARPGQIKRLYQGIGKEVPNRLRKQALHNIIVGKNYI